MRDDLLKRLEELKNPERAKISQRFFRTGRGQYGEGDIFWGISVPDQRKVSRDFLDLSLQDIDFLLRSSVHEVRFTALMILVFLFEKSDFEKKREIFLFYLEHSSYINNWDLVDVSAPKIVGQFLLTQKREILFQMAQSQNLWVKRISVVSCLPFIKNGQFEDICQICELLMKDQHDLIHKACGWMLREVGKRNIFFLENFLEKNASFLPRTTLRYAIERMDRKERLKWLKR